MRQILWGLFKKIIIADQCAQYANLIFNDAASYSGSTLLLGAVFFAFQIYGDFSGYSDIALGTARLFGIELLQNFNYPYFSRDIAEFWRRWHISLSSWFKDYVYIPLGGSKGSVWMKIRNTAIIFLLSGFWHGANWTFIAWGLLNAIYFMPLLLTNSNRANLEIVAKESVFPRVREFFSMLLTFALTLFAWIFFRADTIMQAFSYVAGIFSKSFFTMPSFYSIGEAKKTMLFVLIFLIIEWWGRAQPYAIARLDTRFKWPVRWAAYYAMIWLIINYGNKGETFIYFQF